MLVGREAERARLTSLLTGVREGRSGALVVRGEAGSGKSALCAWAEEQADGVTVLSARGVQSESRLAFSLLSDLLRPVVGVIASIPEPQAAALEGALAIGPPAGADRFTICAATLSALAAAADAAPVLAIVDDAHWADTSSLEALAFAARRLDTEGVALVLAARDGIATPLDAAGLEELRLTSLRCEETIELLAAHDVAEAVATDLWTTIGGNPLALLDVLPLLSAAQRDGTVALPSPLPSAPGAAEDRRHLEPVDAVSSERLAWHRAATATEPDDDVATELVAAALGARERGANAAAAAGFERAAELTAGGELQARRLLDAADDHRRSGRSEHAIVLLRRALAATDDPLLRADVQHLHGALETWRGDPLAAHALLTAEAEGLVQLDPRKAAMMLADASWPCYLGGDIARGVAAAARACEVAEQADGPVQVLTAVMLAQGLILQGETVRGRQLLARALPLLELPATVQRAPELVQAAAHVSIWLEDFGVARRLLGLVIDAARAESSPGALPYALAITSELDFRTGNWAAAYATATESLRLAQETGHANGLSFGLVGLARVEAAQGRAVDCREHTGRAMQLAAFGVRALVVYASAVLGHLELAQGRTTAAIEHLEQVARGVERQGIGDPSVVPWAADLVEALLRAGRGDDAELALTLFEQQAAATGGYGARAAAARCRGLTAPDDRLDEAFATSLELHERTIGPFERARTLLCYGERLRRSRRRTDAREPLRAALDTFERLGAAPWVERARAELEATGEHVRRSEEPATQRLTPQELQVALVVARGATNREAGGALFLSPKTIETHLGRIYRKLGVRSRTELSAFLARDGALGEPAAA